MTAGKIKRERGGGRERGRGERGRKEEEREGEEEKGREANEGKTKESDSKRQPFRIVSHHLHVFLLFVSTVVGMTTHLHVPISKNV